MNELFHGRMQGACTKRLYFHFWFKIWRHQRVPRPGLPLRRGNFGYSAINMRYIAHTWSSHISTSGLKSDATIMFIDPDFLKDAKISAIKVNLRTFHCACTKRPYFHFSSKIWRHHRVSRPRFPLRCGNLVDSRTGTHGIARRPSQHNYTIFPHIPWHLGIQNFRLRLWLWP